ncbi:phosphatase PAP2 family protein [Pedobacter arcticus]|uniref:phosphatase PAP2 family protein n=1 Tax=Pedobacter arcticus TaxID=752140 RepID=UPI00036C31F0|nr:phosphatase PAP2 family protein [Pedobacter arcticus]
MKKYRELFKTYINDYKLVPEFSTIIIASVLMMAAIICFYGLTEELAEDDLKVFDNVIINNIVAFRSPVISQIMLSATFIGNLVGYLLIIPILTIFFVIRKNWRLSLEITIVLLLSSGLNIILKNTIERQRPPEAGHLVFAEFYSFPSGHAMSAITFYGFIVYLSFILIKKTWLKYGIILLCILITGLIGVSRVYLGVHYPSDILAGYIAGLGWLMFCILILNLITLSKIKLTESNNLP